MTKERFLWTCARVPNKLVSSWLLLLILPVSKIAVQCYHSESHKTRMASVVRLAAETNDCVLQLGCRGVRTHWLYWMGSGDNFTYDITSRASLESLPARNNAVYSTRFLHRCLLLVQLELGRCKLCSENHIPDASKNKISRPSYSRSTPRNGTPNTADKFQLTQKSFQLLLELSVNSEKQQILRHNKHRITNNKSNK